MPGNCMRYVFVILIIFGSIVIFSLFYKPGIRIKSSSKFQISQPNKTDSESVTQILHQSWKNEYVPERFEHYSRSWTVTCFKDWKYMFWTDEDNLKLIKDHYPWFLAKYTSLPSPIHRADVCRYFYLFHYGGIYTDLDNECLRPFENLLNNSALVFGAMKGQYGGTDLEEGYVQNSFMYSQPRHPFWLEIIFAILNNSENSVPELQTGPILLTNSIKRFRANGHASEIKIYPPEYFNPFSWLYKDETISQCKDFNRMSDDDWKKCRAFFIAKGSYVVQYHAHTWGK